MLQCRDRQHAEMLKSKTHKLALNQTTNLVLKLTLMERRVICAGSPHGMATELSTPRLNTFSMALHSIGQMD